MSLLSYATSGLRENTQVILGNDYRGQQAGTFFFGAGGSPDIDLYVGGDTGKQWYWNAYQFCPTVASIVNRKAEAYISGNTRITNKSGKAKGKESESIAAQKIRKLLSRPNALQSWSQFEAQQYIYYQIYGFCLILPVKPDGFKENIDADSFWIIPPALIDIKESQKIWYNDSGRTMIESIKLKYGSEETTLMWDDVIIIKDFTPACGFSAIPDSRLRALKTPIETVIKGYRAINSGFDNTPLGIIGNDTKDINGQIPMTADAQNELQMKLNGYGLGANQKKFILSDANLNWMPINYPIDSLKIPEGTKMANAAICDGLGFPFELLSSDKGNTFSNTSTAGKALFTKFTIPPSKSIYEQWNEWFNTDAYGILIENDYSHLPELQEDALSKAQARKAGNEAYLIEFQNNIITLNRWMELNSEEPRSDEFGTMYYYELVAVGWKFGAAPAAMQNVNNGTDTNTGSTAEQ